MRGFRVVLRVLVLFIVLLLGVARVAVGSVNGSTGSVTVYTYGHGYSLDSSVLNGFYVDFNVSSSYNLTGAVGLIVVNLSSLFPVYPEGVYRLSVSGVSINGSWVRYWFARASYGGVYLFYVLFRVNITAGTTLHGRLYLNASTGPLYTPQLALVAEDFTGNLSGSWSLPSNWEAENGLLKQTNGDNGGYDSGTIAWVTIDAPVNEYDTLAVVARAKNDGTKSAYDMVIFFDDSEKGTYYVAATVGGYDRWGFPNGSSTQYTDWGEPDERSWNVYLLTLTRSYASISIDGVTYSTLTGLSLANITRIGFDSRGSSEWDYVYIFKYDTRVQVSIGKLNYNETSIISANFHTSFTNGNANTTTYDVFNSILSLASQRTLNNYIGEYERPFKYVFPWKSGCNPFYVRLRIYTQEAVRDGIVRVTLTQDNFPFFDDLPNVMKREYIVPFDINGNHIYYYIYYMNMTSKTIGMLMVLTIPAGGYATVILHICDPSSFDPNYYGLHAVLTHSNSVVWIHLRTINRPNEFYDSLGLLGPVFGSGDKSVEGNASCVETNDGGWFGVISHDLVPLVGASPNVSVVFTNVTIEGDRGGQGTLFLGLVEPHACPCGECRVLQSGGGAIKLESYEPQYSLTGASGGGASSSSGSSSDPFSLCDWTSCFSCDTCKNAASSSSCLGGVKRIGLGEGHTDWELDFEANTGLASTVKGTGLNQHATLRFSRIVIGYDASSGEAYMILNNTKYTFQAPLDGLELARIIVAVNDHDSGYGPVKVCVSGIDYPSLVVVNPSKIEAEALGNYGSWSGGYGGITAPSGVALPTPHPISGPGLAAPGAIAALLLFVALYVFYNQRMPHGLAVAAAFSLAAVASLILWGSKYYAVAIFIAVLGIVLYAKLGK